VFTSTITYEKVDDKTKAKCQILDNTIQTKTMRENQTIPSWNNAGLSPTSSHKNNTNCANASSEPVHDLAPPGIGTPNKTLNRKKRFIMMNNNNMMWLSSICRCCSTSTSASASLNRLYLKTISLFALAFMVLYYIYTASNSSAMSMKYHNTYNPKTTSTSTFNYPLETNTRPSSTSTQTQEEWEPFNTTNPHTEWCPGAQCLNSPLCTPCNRRHFFIISTARSGSTTLLRMINELPNIRISGENHNTFGIESKIETNLLQNKPSLLKHPVDKPTGPFQHNAIPQGSLGCISQHLHYVMNPPPLQIYQQRSKMLSTEERRMEESMILGFKTVRFHVSFKPFAGAKYIRTHFPCSKVLINIQSNITHQLESYMNTFHGTAKGSSTTPKKYEGPSFESLTQVKNFHIKLEKALKNQYKKNNENSSNMVRIVDFDQWKNDVKIINNIVSWIGYEDCKFNSLTHENDNGYGVDATTVVDLGKNCRYPYFNE